MNGKIQILKGDITLLDVEAVVNAANSGLRGGGGVDGAIHRAAGPQLDEECMKIISKIGSCPTGDAVITSAGVMKCKYVIHAVGPVWHGGNHNESQLLANAYRNSLRIALEYNIKSIAFPNISTGIYGFPKETAAKIAIDEVNDFLQKDDIIENVIFCCFDSDNYDLYSKLLEKN